MRPSILTFLILFLLGFSAAGQKLKDYRFVYRLQPDNFNDTEKVVIETFKNSESIATINGVIKNYQLKPIGFLTVIFKSADTTVKTMTNENGLFSVKLKPSNYVVTIAGVNYKTLTKQIQLDTNNAFNLTITLASQTPMNWFNIHARKKLSETGINNIKNCIQNNEQPFDKCNKKYIITSHLKTPATAKEIYLLSTAKIKTTVLPVHYYSSSNFF